MRNHAHASARSTASGALVLVVGPSGAGKDTLMDYARAALREDPRFVFARRVVTRMSSGLGEDHDCVDDEAFSRLQNSGDFALHWHAHGLSYAIPASIHAQMAAAKVVIANVSRSVIAQAEQVVETVIVLHITAAPHVLAQRLAGRGRETADDILQRLQRDAPLRVDRAPVVTVRNEGTIEAAAAHVLDVLRGAAQMAQINQAETAPTP
jgi:phosphonate metabolism protein PhnN/1,5-bisphosphokinase (PRPP-forming)